MDIKAAFAKLELEDMWPDAALYEAILYARGSTHLNIPDDWRPYLPTSLPGPS